MISPTERQYILKNAYVPEHLPHYVTSISRTEPFLVGDFVVHVAGPNIVFVGYPLTGIFEEGQLLAALVEAKSRFKPDSIAMIAPKFPDVLDGYTLSASDSYYRLELSALRISQKTRNMLTRARQEVTISIGKFSQAHKKLVDHFLKNHCFENATKFIFEHVKEYVECETALIFEARNTHGDLVAFDVAEFDARTYAFYMFNFRSRKYNVPGTSDLLLSSIIERAKAEGKSYINLGLGINPGIAFFKQKWGGSPFLSYVAGSQESKRNQDWAELLGQFSGL